MELFLDQDPLPFEFEKNAAEVALPEDPNQWPNEILQELYKQVSFIADFSTHVVLDRVDAEKGYAFGHVLVASKTESPAGAPPEQEQAAGIRKARIPIIVKERKLYPFDVIITESSKMLPLTEPRIRQALFRPQMFDVTSKTPGDISMIGQLYPPYRQNYGFGGGGAVVNMGMGKTGEAKQAGARRVTRLMGAAARAAKQEGRPLESMIGHPLGQALDRANDKVIRRNSRYRPIIPTNTTPIERTRGQREAVQAGIKNMLKHAPEDEGTKAMLQYMNKQANAPAPPPGLISRIRSAGRSLLEIPTEARATMSKVTNAIDAQNAALKDIKETGAKNARNAAIAMTLGGAGIAGAGLAGGYGVHKAHQMEKALQQLPQYQRAQAEVAKEGQVVAPSGPSVDDDEWLQRKAFGLAPPVPSPTARKTASMLSFILPTINESDFNRLASELDQPEVKMAFVRNAPAAAALLPLSVYEPISREKRAMAIANALRYDVAQVNRNGDGTYRLKVASHHMWAPIEHTIDRGQLVQLLGTKIALAVDQTGGVTVADGAASGSESPEAGRPEPIKDFGLYRVETKDGRSLVGYVFPNLIDVDGTSLPLALFTNGSEYAMQGDICGVKAGEGMAIPEGRPRGNGVLFRVMPNGKAEATVPIDIKTSLDAGEGVQFLATSFAGDQVRLVPAPNVKSLTAAPGGAILMPDTMRWLTLADAKQVELCEHPEECGQKQAAARQLLTIDIRSGGSDHFSLSGMPVEKLAHDQREGIGLDDAVFLLAGYGIQPEYAFKKLGESLYAGRPIEVMASRLIKTAADRYAETSTLGSEILDLVPQLRQPFLVKEAATIPDTTAVDTVLSLGFLNPENMVEFLKAMPILDDAQSRMCELLVGARLGMKEVPTGALEKAIKATENVIEGLRVLAFQEN